VRRQGHDVHDAQDLTPGFFELFIAKHYLKDVARDKGRFRSFLLASLKHYLANEWKKANRQKRGGLVETTPFDASDAEERYQHEPADESAAELIYDRRWARSVLDSVTAKLRDEFTNAGKGEGERQHYCPPALGTAGLRALRSVATNGAWLRS
jgi:RNA polymerase sigma-70 factor (ECF subfamily)